MPKYIILDTETTGASEQDRIIQLGYMVLDGKSVEVYNDFCSSEVPISIGAMEVHGITPEMIKDRATCIETTAYKKLQELNSDDNYMIIHNAPFDVGMLQKEGFSLNMKLIDTLRCAKHIFEDEEAHRLQYFRYKFDIYKNEKAEADKLGIEIKAHDAIGDVLVLKLFLTKLREAVALKFPNVNAVEKMVELTKLPVLIKTFKFGKYKGQHVADVAKADPSYLQWMQKNMELDEDLAYTLKVFLG
jgi:DNA polymerase III epsilon subunit-like protein